MSQHQRVQNTVQRARLLLRDLYTRAAVGKSHDLSHADAVLKHAQQAIEHEKLTDKEQLAVLLAALLHDADDHKLFGGKSHHAYLIMLALDIHSDVSDMVLRMINLVSTSSNGNEIPTNVPLWYLIPRFCDRLEAIGEIGIRRCWEFTHETKMPLLTKETKRARTNDQLYKIATPERFAEYKGKSHSMLDHYYDKLLHIAAGIQTKNPYLVKEVAGRHQQMEAVCLWMGEHGDVESLDALVSHVAKIQQAMTSLVELKTDRKERGALIVFEGPDGCGKTTQAVQLTYFLGDRITRRTKGTLIMAFPDRKTATGKILDAYLQKTISLNDQAVHLLFAANRWEKRDDIVNEIQKGYCVIVDRYSYSGIVYSATKGMDVQWCMSAEHGLPAPDAVIYLSMSPERPNNVCRPKVPSRSVTTISRHRKRSGPVTTLCEPRHGIRLTHRKAWIKYLNKSRLLP